MSTFTFSRRQFISSCLAGSLLCGVEGANAQSQVFTPFSFVFVTDCHLTTGKADNYMLLQESQIFLQDMVKQINSIKPDFVIFGGDQVQGIGDNDANWQLFLDIVQSLECPWYFVLGETDVSGHSSMNKMISYGRDWKGRGLESDKPYWVCDVVPSVKLIGLDSSQPDSTLGYVDQNQLSWLEQTLSRDNDQLVIVICHHPLLEQAQLGVSPSYLLPQASQIRHILEKTGKTILCLNGHMHVSNIQEHNNIWYIANPSLDVYPCSFRLFKISSNEVAINTFQIHFPALVKKARNNLLNSHFAELLSEGKPENFLRLTNGRKVDQNARLSLSKIGIMEILKAPGSSH